MPLVTTGSIVESVREVGRGVAAFNVITIEHAEAVAQGAEQIGQPAIFQISENAVSFHGGCLRPLASAVAAIASDSSAPLSLHLDHVEDEQLLKSAAGTGISSVMFDASRLEYADNVEATRAAVQWAHEHDLWLEAELGEIGGKDGAHAPGVRTDPDDAAGFVAATGVDALAVAVGSSHAMLDRSASIDLDLIRELAQKLPVPLVLHGSSGVPDEALAASVRAGMVKINIGTMLNIAFTRAVREALAADDRLVDPRKYLRPARDAIAVKVAQVLGVVSAQPASA